MKKLIIALFIIILVCSALLPGAVAAAAANSAPQLLETSCVENQGDVVCLVQFKSVAGKKYRVYRRAPLKQRTSCRRKGHGQIILGESIVKCLFGGWA